MKKVLILGGGFAGVEAAIYLKKQNIDVLLVSDRDYFYIYPTSIWIPTGGTTREDISIPLSLLSKKHGFDFVVDTVVSFDARDKKVGLKSGKVLDDFYYIVLAMGQDKVKHKGAKNTLSICGKPEDADKLYSKITKLVNRGYGKIAVGFGGNPKDTSAVRGGPAFEVLFNIDYMLKKKGLRDKFKLTFFAPMQKPGQKMGEKALAMMDKMLAKSNIDKKVGSKIVEFTENEILFENKSRLEADLIMFIPAGTGHSILKNSALKTNEAGFVITNEYNEVEEFDGIYAIGDSASLMGENWRAKQGHVAEVMARNIAYNISNKMKNISSKHSYIKHLNIICVMDTGNSAAFVYRNSNKGVIIPMPIFGHWMKKAWGWYCKYSKLGKIPRIPGM